MDNTKTKIDSYYEFYKNRRDEILPTVTEWADPLSVDIITELNKLPGVVTTWSCSGHMLKGEGGNTKTYYAMVTDGESDRILRDIARNVFNELFRGFERSGVKHDKNKAYMFSYIEKHLYCVELEVWYPTIVLELKAKLTHDMIVMTNSVLLNEIRRYTSS